MNKFFKKIKLLWQWWRIPWGDYCHFSAIRGRGKSCPYWDAREDWPDQAFGYCHLLGYGDMDINNDEERILINTKTGEEVAAPDMPFGVGLLWDQCKECGLKEESLWMWWERRRYWKKYERNKKDE
ncbi:hypothetical protein LCGC14_2415090 [marine sediment metagenome]|uniref:Uncharacterized protein n=1 Tax=marine sediment metagenome TaxID=412755 RepID=A0A0F9BRC5_9ZZZZ